MPQRLICCLGNPGDQYQHTRHNIGFRVGEAMIASHSLSKAGKKFNSIIYQGMIKQCRVKLLFPQLFMNLSGEPLQKICYFYDISYSDVLVIYDDIDLPFQTIRYREKGSAGTHNGMRSVIKCIKTPNIPRLRIGIGPKPDRWALSDFVLGKFSSEEEEKMDEVIAESLVAVDRWI